jgi:hypothetical protein
MSKPIEEIIAEAMFENIVGDKTKRNIDEKINDIANKNKKLFDAHVKAGFTEEQALQIIVAFINH